MKIICVCIYIYTCISKTYYVYVPATSTFAIVLPLSKEYKSSTLKIKNKPLTVFLRRPS